MSEGSVVVTIIDVVEYSRIVGEMLLFMIKETTKISAGDYALSLLDALPISHTKLMQPNGHFLCLSCLFFFMIFFFFLSTRKLLSMVIDHKMQYIEFRLKNSEYSF